MTVLEARWFSRLDRWAAVAWRFVIVIVAIALAAWLLTQLRIILIPSVFALFLCTVLMPVQRFYSRLRLPRSVASLFTVLSGFIAVAIIVTAMVPPVVAEWDDLVDNINTAYDDIYLWLEDGPIGLSESQVGDLRANVESGQDILLERLASGAIAGLPVVVEVLIGILLAIVLTFFFLRDGDRMWAWGVGLLPAEQHRRAQRAGNRAWDTLGRYLRGMAIVALFDAVAIGLGAFILDLPLVVPIAVVTFFTAFIPIVGAFAAGAVAVLIALAAGGPSTALWMLAVVVAVQQLEGNVISPAVVGRSVEIHPIVVLLGVTGGGAIAGVMGAILATPAIAVMYVLVRELLGDDEPLDAPAPPQPMPPPESDPA